MTDEPKVLTKEELRELVRDVLAEHHELIGQPVDTTSAREELRADAAFLRRLRHLVDGAATKVGYFVLMTVVASIIGLLTLGAGVKIGH